MPQSEIQLLRRQIGEAIAAGNDVEACYLLGQLWLQDPSAAVAAFIAHQAQSLRCRLPLIEHRLYFLRSFTVEPVFPLLTAQAFLYGVDAQVQAGGFNAYVQEMLDPASALYAFSPHTTIFAAQTRDVLPPLWDRYPDLDPTEVSRLVEETGRTISQAFETFRKHSSANLIVQSFERPAYETAPAQFDAIHRLNSALVDTAARVPGVYLLDYDQLISRHGRLAWFDEQKWNFARMPLSATALRPMADELLRFVLPLAGRIAKVLVADLDNTLWGGVVGEDGLGGIRVGSDASGAPFLAIQRAMLDLSRRGILLAVCSKNNATDALEAIDRHPGMLLRREHFAAVQINWDDKAANLRKIASQLNVGIESLALVDDNPVERDRIRRELPEVFVLELCADPGSYALAVREHPAFSRLTITDEDRQRAKLYAQERERSELQESLVESGAALEEYYRSLKTVITLQSLCDNNLERITQLTQKTNQFNLTTIRYTEQQLLEMTAHGNVQAFGASVRDRFGDSGIVGVLITKRTGEVVEIDTLLLSCRVIGRTIETGLLADLLKRASRDAAKVVKGRFVPTKKNAPAKDFFLRHGFELVREEVGGAQEWCLAVDHHRVMVPDWLEFGS